MNVAKRAAYVACLPVAIVLVPTTFLVGLYVGMAGTLVGGVGLGLYASGKYIATGEGVSVEKYSGYVTKYFHSLDAATRMPDLLFKCGSTSQRVVPVEQDDPIEFG